MKPTGKVFLVGAGPGDPGLLTLRAAALLRRADMLLYDALVSEHTLAFAGPDCERIFVGKRGGNHALPQSEIEAMMVRFARANKCVVRLKGGDPFVFGRGGEEAEALRAARVPFEIVPGISSAIAAPAYAGIPLTHREHSSAVTIATGHEDPTKGGTALDWSKLADPRRTLVFMMAVGNLAEIARQLQSHGLDADTPVAVIQNGTLATQRTAIGTLATIASEIERAGVAAPAVVVIGGVVKLRERTAWFDATPLFGKRVLITRAARQAADLANALFERGAEPIIAPTIAIEPPDDPPSIAEILTALGAGGWVAFTSESAVAALFTVLERERRDVRALGPCRVAAIGPATAEALRDRGLQADLVPTEFVGEALANALIDSTEPGERVTIFCAQEARDVLSETLARNDRDVTRFHLYKTALAAGGASLADQVARAQIVTFASSSAVRGYAQALGGDNAAVAATRGKVVACIGPVTADAARALGLNVDAIAATFTAEGLLDAIETHLTQPC